MIDPEQYPRVLAALPFLKTAGDDVLRDLRDWAHVARIPAGLDVFVEGDQSDAIALLLSGAVRVYKIGETGREITLYRFGNGESCILTANAILSQQTFPAIATVEETVEAVMIPAGVFRDWVRRYDIWRNFVFDLLSQRLSSLMTTVDDVLFRRLDGRVAALLLAHSQGDATLRITHQEIAAELGSSREGISRILEGFTGDGLIRSTRGMIELTDVAGLRDLAAM
jgi:CRP/FNR family transcriptional regulator